MLRVGQALLGQPAKHRGSYNLGAPLGRITNFRRARTFQIKTTDSETVIGRGKVQRRREAALQSELASMETPAIWVWYPWRSNPEPPTPALPLRRALKNLHGAVYSELSPRQKKRMESMTFGSSIPDSRQANFERQHPLLAQLFKGTQGRASAFPFWYKKYPTRRHAYENRFNIPAEMLVGYSPEIKAAVSSKMMLATELEQAERNMYTERYAEHDFDTGSPAVTAVKVALLCRSHRNSLLKQPHNTVYKFRLCRLERTLYRALRRLRKVNFKRYWEIISEHDIQDIVQPPNAVSYRWGGYWQYDWNAGIAIQTNISDFLDVRGLNGCVETGRSRAEVARDLGLTYTRTLSNNEKKRLAKSAEYYERLKKFRADQPEASRERDRAAFVRKFTGMFAVMNRKSTAVDFPSSYRRLLHSKVLRWKSKRHGPT